MKENLDQESLQLIEYVMINDNNKIYFFLVQRIIPVRSMTAVVQVEMQVYIPGGVRLLGHQITSRPEKRRVVLLVDNTFEIVRT